MTTSLPFRQILYVSQAKDDLRPHDIVQLIKAAWRNNTEHNLSGLLLHNKGQFMQIVEGEPGKVGQLMRNLSRDSRHEHIAILLDQVVPEREFVCWLMGYKRVAPPLKDDELDDISVDIDFLFEIPHPSKAVQLLRSFTRS